MKSKKDCLKELHAAWLLKICEVEIDIRMLESLPPEKVIGEKSTSHFVGGVQGKVQVKAEEGVKIKKDLLAEYQKRLNAIDALLANL